MLTNLNAQDAWRPWELKVFDHFDKEVTNLLPKFGKQPLINLVAFRFSFHIMPKYILIRNILSDYCANIFEQHKNVNVFFWSGINVFLQFEYNIVHFKFKWALLCSLVNCFFATRTTTKHVIDRQPWLSANVMLLLNLLIKEKQSCFTNELSTGGSTESIITLIVRNKSTNLVCQIKIDESTF